MEKLKYLSPEIYENLINEKFYQVYTKYQFI